MAEADIMSLIKTYDKEGIQNGTLTPLWHVDSGVKIDQVYATTVFPWKVKGPHLHKTRRGLFCCVRGEVILVIKRGIYQLYDTHSMKPGDPLMMVPPGVPAALYNPGGIEAIVLNFPSPPWCKDEQDEWPVEDWTWKP